MIKKCDYPNCSKAGVCRAPKARDLKEYYWFCKEHAAEYNKNWNYYAGMTTDEIEDDWERETFGISDKERKTKEKANADYVAFLQNFLTGRESRLPPLGGECHLGARSATDDEGGLHGNIAQDSPPQSPSATAPPKGEPCSLGVFGLVVFVNQVQAQILHRKGCFP